MDLNQLFYVGDQMASFWKSVAEELDLPPSIRLVTEKQMANAGILTSLITMYIDKKGLKNAGTRRFFVDDRMRQFFSTTHPTLFNNRFKVGDIQGLKGDKLECETEKILHGERSMFSLLAERRQGGDYFLDEDGQQMGPPFSNQDGLVYASIMVINSRYRINRCYLDEQRRDELRSAENVALSRDLRDFLRDYHLQMREEMRADGDEGIGL